jgi:hypothetical protein
MAPRPLEDALPEAANFLSEFCWLFNFANIQVVGAMDKWPTEWLEFLRGVTSVDDLGPML